MMAKGERGNCGGGGGGKRETETHFVEIFWRWFGNCFECDALVKFLINLDDSGGV